MQTVGYPERQHEHKGEEDGAQPVEVDVLGVGEASLQLSMVFWDGESCPDGIAETIDKSLEYLGIVVDDVAGDEEQDKRHDEQQLVDDDGAPGEAGGAAQLDEGEGIERDGYHIRRGDNHPVGLVELGYGLDEEEVLEALHADDQHQDGDQS